LDFTGGTRANLQFVIVKGGEEVLLMVVDSGTIETGIAKRITEPTVTTP
jgi:hypothetical protein